MSLLLPFPLLFLISFDFLLQPSFRYLFTLLLKLTLWHWWHFNSWISLHGGLLSSFVKRVYRWYIGKWWQRGRKFQLPSILINNRCRSPVKRMRHWGPIWLLCIPWIIYYWVDRRIKMGIYRIILIAWETSKTSPNHRRRRCASYWNLRARPVLYLVSSVLGRRLPLIGCTIILRSNNGDHAIIFLLNIVRWGWRNILMIHIVFNKNFRVFRFGSRLWLEVSLIIKSYFYRFLWFIDCWLRKRIRKMVGYVGNRPYKLFFELRTSSARRHMKICLRRILKGAEGPRGHVSWLGKSLLNNKWYRPLNCFLLRTNPKSL